MEQFEYVREKERRSRYAGTEQTGGPHSTCKLRRYGTVVEATYGGGYGAVYTCRPRRRLAKFPARYTSSILVENNVQDT
jgi:hypothetical protein